MDTTSPLLLLLIHLGPDTYGLDVMDIVEVIPRIEVRPIPQAPDYVAGLISYRGTVVPLIDLKMMMRKEPCEAWLSTRIVIAECPVGEISGNGEGTGKMTLAVLGERITETISVSQSELQSSGIEMSENSYLGKVTMRDQRMVQILRVAHILPSELKEMLARAAKSK